MSDLSSSDTSDSDVEELLTEEFDLINGFLIKNHAVRNVNYSEEIVEQYTAMEFKTHFRISRELTEEIAELYRTSDYFPTAIGGSVKVTPFKSLLIFLWFAGHQTSSFRDVADRFDITISTLFRILKRITMFLSNLSRTIILWPDEAKKVITEQHYQNKGFLGVIGCVDGTHIKIDRPDNDPDAYINRKGYFSIQMQGVCNEDKEFIDIFIGYPGSVHDARVFRNSELSRNLRNKCGTYYLLGDSAYPCLANLMTPFRDNGHLTNVQTYFNTNLSKCRIDIEHTFGILKQKFRQLYHIKFRKPQFIAHFIRACCVLHNLSRKEELNFEIETDNEVNAEENAVALRDQDLLDAPDGMNIRNDLARILYLRRN